jgi:acyl carrier protein
MVFDKVKEIITQQLEVDPAKVTMDAKLNEDLKADSVEVVGIIMNLESEFNMEFPYEDLEKIKTVGDTVKYIEGQSK